MGASLVQIALSLFTLERSFLSGTKERFKKKIEDRRANWQILLLSSSLMSDLKKRDRRQKVEFKFRQAHHLGKLFYIFPPCSFCFTEDRRNLNNKYNMIIGNICKNAFKLLLLRLNWSHVGTSGRWWLMFCKEGLNQLNIWKVKKNYEGFKMVKRQNLPRWYRVPTYCEPAFLEIEIQFILQNLYNWLWIPTQTAKKEVCLCW